MFNVIPQDNSMYWGLATGDLRLATGCLVRLTPLARLSSKFSGDAPPGRLYNLAKLMWRTTYPYMADATQGVH